MLGEGENTLTNRKTLTPHNKPWKEEMEKTIGDNKKVHIIPRD